MKIEVKKGLSEDFIALSKLDYTNTYDSMHSISYSNKDKQISFFEIKLPKSIKNESKVYIDEIMEDVIEDIKALNSVSLVVFYENNPAWYLLAKWEKWWKSEVLDIRGILVSNNYSRKWLWKALVLKCIELAKENKNCRGIYAEMDTTKYQANKLLIHMWFEFAGTKFFIYWNEKPNKYSKEAIYFFYPINK